MDEISTFGELIALWPSRDDLATDLGVKKDRVHKWVQNNTIPAGFWRDLLAAAARRGIPLSADVMVTLAAPGPDVRAAE